MKIICELYLPKCNNIQQNILISNILNLKNFNKKEPAKASSKFNSKNSLCRKAKGVLVIYNLIF